MRGLRAAVTGGGSGIGAAVAQDLALAGASVVLMGRNASRLREQAVRIGGEVQRLDVSDETSVQAAFEAIGPVDILVNNAGQVETSPLKATTLDTLEAHAAGQP